MSDTAGKILFANHTNEDVAIYVGPNQKPPTGVSGIWVGVVKSWTTSGIAVSGYPLYAVGCLTQNAAAFLGSHFQDCEFVVYDVAPGNAVTVAFTVATQPSQA